MDAAGLRRSLKRRAEASAAAHRRQFDFEDIEHNPQWRQQRDEQREQRLEALEDTAAKSWIGLDVTQRKLCEKVTLRVWLVLCLMGLLFVFAEMAKTTEADGDVIVRAVAATGALFAVGCAALYCTGRCFVILGLEEAEGTELSNFVSSRDLELFEQTVTPPRKACCPRLARFSCTHRGGEGSAQH